MLAIVKPKQEVLLRYGNELKCYVYLKPQQKWIVHALNEHYVNLESKTKKIDIQVSARDFARLFEYVV